MNIRNRAGRLAMDEARAHEQVDVIGVLSRYIDRTLDREIRIQFNTLVFPKGGVLDVAAFGTTASHMSRHCHRHPLITTLPCILSISSLLLLFATSPQSITVSIIDGMDIGAGSLLDDEGSSALGSSAVGDDDDDDDDED